MIESLQLEVRPRTPWEAAELGVRLGQFIRVKMILYWLVLTLPLLVLLRLYTSPGWAVFLLWWLKPVWDRFFLHMFSLAVFKTELTFSSVFGFFKRIHRTQLISSLTIMRLAPGRSFSLPVRQLEGVTGRNRSTRLAVLIRGKHYTTAVLTLFHLVVLQTILTYGIMLMIFLFTTQDIMSVVRNFTEYMSVFRDFFYTGHTAWLPVLISYLVMSILEPVYTAAGFCLYLDRRSGLELWDVEVIFRRLADRLNLAKADG